MARVSITPQWSRHLSQPESRRDDDPKRNQFDLEFGKRVWSRHHSLFLENYGKNHKDKARSTKPDSGFGSRLRVGKVLAPYNACPKAVPLIKCANLMWFFKMFNYP